MTLFSTGNLAINTTTDAGFRLDVNGTARVQGNLIEVTNGTNKIAITSTQISCLAGVSVNDLNIVAGPISAPNSILGIGTTVSGGSTTILRLGAGNATNASGIVTIIESPRGFAPTSGTATFSFATWNGTINQTGGANGITRGLFIDPTLTAAADFRAIETTRGNVLFGTTSGNVGIGTSSPTYKLDVNGDTKTLGLLTAYGISTNLSDMAIYNTTNNTGYIRFITQTASAQAERMRIFNTGNVAIGTTTDSGFKLEVNGTAKFNGNVFLPLDLLIGSGQSTSVWNRIMLYDGTNGAINITMHNPAWYIRHNANMSMDGSMQVGSNTSAVASAVLQATSTTKGFLPPRMTQTQRNAIASPAIGLEIYQTDATEGKYIYKSSGWTYIG
jgi:hypothetical protein